MPKNGRSRNEPERGIGEPDSTLTGDSTPSAMEEMASRDDWVAKYREIEDRQRRRLRLQHTTAIVGIVLTSGVLALSGKPALGVRFLVAGVILYMIVSVVLGLLLQWKRELDN